MRIGTFACWLWGHKFIGKNRKWSNGIEYVDIIKQLPCCIRCGIDRETKK